MAYNKVVLGEETLIDITDTTAEEDSVLEGVNFYGADGSKKTGVVPKRKITDIEKADLENYLEEAEVGEIVITEEDGGEGGGASTWEELQNKPFETIGEGLEVDENGVLSSIAKGGILPRLHIVSEPGSTVTVIKDDITLTPTEMSGVWECDIPEYGTWTIHSVNPDGDAVATVYIDTVKIYNIDDSHFSATIIATFPSGATCSCSKGEQAYYATTSPFTFSVHSTGTWVVAATRDGVTVSKEINIVNEGQSANVTLEMATVRLTVDEEFIGSEITGTNGTDTKRWTADSTEHVFTVNFGTWKFSTTKDDKLYETSEIVVDSYIEYEANIKFAHVLDYTEWLTAGKVTKSFDSLESVLADQEVVRQLMTVHASVDYLCANCDEASAETIFNAYYVMKWVNISDYALDKLSEVAEIKVTMDSVGMYGYGEVTCELKGIVPIMTDFTIPSGEVSSSDNRQDTYSAWHIFDGNSSTSWYEGNPITKNAWLQYKFDKPTVINGFEVKNWRSNSGWPKNLQLQASNDGNNFVNIGDLQTPSYVSNQIDKFYVDNNKAYLYWRVQQVNGMYGSGTMWNCEYLQFCINSPTLKGCVPVMTSNTAPYGEAFDNANDTVRPCNAFDKLYNSWFLLDTGFPAYDIWVGYRFTNPTCVRKVMLQMEKNITATIYRIEYSNDKSNWTAVENGKVFTYDISKVNYVDIDNDIYALYWRLYIVSEDYSDRTAYKGRVSELQFYGRELKVSVPKMTSNTAPWGEVSASNARSGYEAYKALDNTYSTFWYTDPTYRDNQWLEFEFPKEVCVKALYVRNPTWDIKNTLMAFKLQAYNDGNWIDLTTEYNVNNLPKAQVQAGVLVTSDNTNGYTRYRILAQGGDTESDVVELHLANFYGVDYSEKEFAEGSTVKYLYDHGVEVESIETTLASMKKDSEIDFKHETSTNTILFANTVNKFNMTAYNLLRLVGYGSAIGNYDTRFGVGTTPTSRVAQKQPSNNLYGQFLDISSVTSECCVVGFAEGTTSSEATLHIIEWWLE